MSLFELLKTDAWDVVGKYLEKKYIKNPEEMKRQALARRRDDFVEGKGQLEIERLVETAFKDAKTQELRKELVEWSGWDNLMARIVREIATVYSAPTSRKIKNNDPVFQAFIRKVRLDHVMREVDRKIAYHEDVAIFYRVRVTPRGRQPVIDVVSPASFWAIAHPEDPTMLVGIILNQRDATAKPTEAAYRVWTDDQTFVMNGSCQVMEETIKPWPFGRMPCVLATTRMPGVKPTLLSECPSADLLAAQSAVWLQNLLLLKESKSANRQAFVKGDTSAMALGQSSDTETEVMLPEGTSIDTVDRGMDLKQFRDNAEHIADTCGANHGVPASIRKQSGATSGAELHLRMLPIRGLRQERIPTMRDVETELVEVMAMVNSRRSILMPDDNGNEHSVEIPGDLQNFEFSAEGFSVDFGEIAQPLTEAEADAVYEQRRRLLLTDGVAEERKRNPDIQTDAEAMGIIEKRIETQTEIVAKTKELQALNGSADTIVGEKTAAENGADGKAAAGKKPDEADEDDPKNTIPFPFKK